MSIAMPLANKITLESSKEVTFNVLEASFGDGYSQVAPNGINNIVDNWDITWAPLTGDEKNTVVAALESSLGTDYLLWQPCSEATSKKFRLVKGYSLQLLAGDTYRVSCAVKQIYDIV